MSEKPSNPKDIIGATKLDFSCIPTTALAHLATAMYEGKVKYGGHNYRGVGVRASVYYAAGMRHRMKWWEGQNADPVTRVHELASSMACDAIILDAEIKGLLNDDRPIPQELGKLLEQLSEVQQHLTELHKDKNPKHWLAVMEEGTITDDKMTPSALGIAGMIKPDVMWTFK